MTAIYRTAASELSLPVWVSWTLNETEPKLRSGETIAVALEVLHDAGLLSAAEGQATPPVSAVLFNCTSPEVITLALKYEQLPSVLS